MPFYSNSTEINNKEIVILSSRGTSIPQLTIYFFYFSFSCLCLSFVITLDPVKFEVIIIEQLENLATLILSAFTYVYERLREIFSFNTIYCDPDDKNNEDRGESGSKKKNDLEE